MKHFEIKIKGKVQGVFFRANAKEVATNLELTGFVKNEADGSVLIQVEGPEEKLQEFITWCRTGSVRSRVESVDCHEIPAIGRPDFIIRKEE